MGGIKSQAYSGGVLSIPGMGNSDSGMDSFLDRSRKKEVAKKVEEERARAVIESKRRWDVQQSLNAAAVVENRNRYDAQNTLNADKYAAAQKVVQAQEGREKTKAEQGTKVFDMEIDALETAKEDRKKQDAAFEALGIVSMMPTSREEDIKKDISFTKEATVARIQNAQKESDELYSPSKEVMDRIVEGQKQNKLDPWAATKAPVKPREPGIQRIIGGKNEFIDIGDGQLVPNDGALGMLGSAYEGMVDVKDFFTGEDTNIKKVTRERFGTDEKYDSRMDDYAVKKKLYDAGLKANKALSVEKRQASDDAVKSLKKTYKKTVKEDRVIPIDTFVNENLKAYENKLRKDKTLSEKDIRGLVGKYRTSDDFRNIIVAQRDLLGDQTKIDASYKEQEMKSQVRIFEEADKQANIIRTEDRAFKKMFRGKSIDAQLDSLIASDIYKDASRYNQNRMIKELERTTLQQ